MKTLSLLLLFGALLITADASAQDNCKMMGQKNPHGMAMKIMAPITVMDSVNFSAKCMNTLPFNMGTKDTIWFDVCILATDGKMHSTQIRYNSDMGVISYNISMQAPSQAAVPENGTLNHAASMSLYPNPAHDYVRVRVSNAPSALTIVQLVDSKGTPIAQQIVSSDGDVTINTTAIATGDYRILLRSGERILSSEQCVIVH